MNGVTIKFNSKWTEALGIAAATIFAQYAGKWFFNKFIMPPTPMLLMSKVSVAGEIGVIKAAAELKVFTHIAKLEREKKNATIATLAELCNTSFKGMRVLLDALAVQGFIVKYSHGSHRESDWSYTLTKDSRAFLDEASPTYFGAVPEFILSDKLIKSAMDMTNAVRRGGAIPDNSTVSSEADPVWVKFARGMGNMQSFPAEAVAKIVVKDTRTSHDQELRVLDISAGHGMYGLKVCQKHKKAIAVGLDAKDVLAVATENAQKLGLEDRFVSMSGDAIGLESYGAPGSYDVVLIPNFLHHFDFETNVATLKKAYACLKPNGRLYISEFTTNEERTGPVGCVLFSVTMLCTTEKGDAYTSSQFHDMCVQAGFKNVKHHRHRFPDFTTTVAHKC